MAKVPTTRERLLLTNSIERVINTSIRLVETTDDEDTFINLEDWDALKPIVVDLWNKARDEAFGRVNELD